MTHLGIHRRKVEVHLPGIFRRERFHLQIDHQEAAKLQVVEKQVEIKVHVSDNYMHLPTDECKPGTEFQQELLDVIDQAKFQIPFNCVVVQGQEVE